MDENSNNPNAEQKIPPQGPTGYGRPPESTRFKPGVSGNPKGRPKGSLNVATVFVKALREKITVNEHGRRKTVTKLEAALKQLINKAASGDLRALNQLLQLAADAEARASVVGTQTTELNQLDQQVMADIVSRFQLTQEETENPKEDENGNSQCE